MQHGILGAGGVGGLVGAVLAHAGENVTLIVRPGSDSQHPRELTLESRFGVLRAPVSVTTRAQQPLEVLWITVKATELEQALNSVPRNLQVAAIVPLLNGIDHVEKLRARYSRDQVVPATIAVESERVAPGRIVQRSPFIRLNLASSGKERLAAPVDLLQRFGFECKFVDDEPTLLWSKLALLAPLALATAANRSAIGAVVSDPQKLSRLERCVREACAVAAAHGAKINAERIFGAIKALPPQMRSSMEKDVSKGKAPEVDAIAGPVIRGGEKYGIPVPATAEYLRTLTT
jgi:2-dehydropantoate 2-reductase